MTKTGRLRCDGHNDVALPREDKIIVLDELRLHSISLTSQGYEIGADIVRWHYEDKEKHGHEREVELDDGEIRPSE